jgi:hypothetical protein
MDNESNLIWKLYKEQYDESSKRFEIKVGKIMQGVGEDSDTVNFPTMQLHDDPDSATIELIVDAPGGREYEIAAFHVSVIDRRRGNREDLYRIIKFFSREIPEDEQFNLLSQLEDRDAVNINSIEELGRFL